MKLNIFGHMYRVFKCKELPIANTRGLCSIDEKVILIHEDYVGSEYMQILLHEIFHATFARASINQAEISHDLEEIICDTLATVITDNFHLRPKK
jgi:hypothetical protein